MCCVLGVVQPSISSLAEHFQRLGIWFIQSGPWFVHSCRQTRQQLLPDRAVIVPTPSLHPAPQPITATRETGKKFPSAPSLASFSCSAACFAASKGKCQAAVKMNVVSHPAVSSSGWWSVALTPLLSEPVSCQWHSLNLCLSPASETTTGGAVCWWRDVAFPHLLLLLA